MVLCRKNLFYIGTVCNVVGHLVLCREDLGCVETICIL